MLTGLIQNVAPSTYPLNLCDLKQHLGITDSLSDARLTRYLAAAVNYCEGITGRCFMSQQWTEYYDCFPYGHKRASTITTFKSPIISINSLVYYDTNNTLQTINLATQTNILLPSNMPAKIEPIAVFGSGLTTWWVPVFDYRPDAVQLNYTAGWTNLPVLVSQAIEILITYWNDGNRGSNDLDIPNGFERLLNPGLLGYANYA